MNHSKIHTAHQILCFLGMLFLCSEAPQVVEPVNNEQGTLEWLRDAPYSLLLTLDLDLLIDLNVDY